MLRRLQTLLQRKFKILLFFLLLLALLMHMALDLVLPATPSSCRCTSKAANPLGLPPPGPVVSVQKKLSLRILQDFSSSNSSVEKGARLLEGRPPTGGGTKMVLRDRDFKHQWAGVKLARAGRSKLAALFEHPLYKMPIPELMEKDKLFTVNPKEKFTLKSSGSDEW